jgi:hypothetical protein
MTFMSPPDHPGRDDQQASVASSFVRPDSATSLDARRRAVVAALRAIREEPTPPKPIDHSAEIAALRADLRRLTERLSRVEDTVELLGEQDEAPLSWPTPVATDNALEVPPLEVSRKSSPAFDVLLGPPPPKQERDSA